MPAPARSTLATIAVVIPLSGFAWAAPDELVLGKAAGYPIGTARSWFYDEGVRVGSFSHLDRILPHNVLKKSASPWRLETALLPRAIRYSVSKAHVHNLRFPGSPTHYRPFDHQGRAGARGALSVRPQRPPPVRLALHGVSSTATAETVVLIALLRDVVGGSISDYLSARLWQPMGTEADATWITTHSDGYENGGGSFNAVLRDYGRLGILLANDGRVGDKQVLPRDYLIEATDWRRHPNAFRPRKATPYFGYGYQFWIYPGEKRRFALLGVYGQSILVDPEQKRVLVITAVARNASAAKESLASERDALWRSLVGCSASGEAGRLRIRQF